MRTRGAAAKLNCSRDVAQVLRAAAAYSHRADFQHHDPAAGLCYSPTMDRSHLLALKVDVDTLRGTREGVPKLVELFGRHDAGATFLFSLGPDHTGRAIMRVLRPGFLSKVSRTSVVKHYGFPTLLYGTLLPGPDIGKRARDAMRRCRDAGFEVGIHTWDHVAWQDGVGGASPSWTARQLELACARFKEIFDEPARTHGAAGWQMPVQALRAAQRMGFDYCSDGRGIGPFFPVVKGEVIDCPQLPTTLPTLDELIGLDGATEANVHERLLALTGSPPELGHVFTLHAELEGMRLANVLERLLTGWRAQGYRLVTLRELFASIDLACLPYHEVEAGTLPGRAGTLMTQAARVA